MIDLSLTKLALIGVVALVVIGPEKLPKIARMAGTLLGRAQRYINDVKSEVSRDMALDDLHNIKREVQATAQDIEHNLSQLHTGTFADGSSADMMHAEEFGAKAREFRRNRHKLASRSKHGGRGSISSGASRAMRYGVSRGTAKSFWP
jgi:sec-independent protein translocase protein TatB